MLRRLIFYAVLPAIVGSLVGLVVLALVKQPGGNASASPSDGFAAAVARAAPAVVNVYSRRMPRDPLCELPQFRVLCERLLRRGQRVQGSLGSGVVVRADGHILTNHHVIAASGQISVQSSLGLLHTATLQGYDAGRDLAVLTVCCSEEFEAAQLSPDAPPLAGTDVFTMGYPLGVDDVVATRGIVSSSFNDAPNKRWIVQTDAAINPGNSGGPLFAMDGSVIGINTFVVRDAQLGVNIEGFGFAVAARTVRDALPGLNAGETVGSTDPQVNQGVLEHSDDGQIKIGWNDPPQELSDFLAIATFTNPYAPSLAGWDYGFVFGYQETGAFQAVVVASDGTWEYYRDDSGDIIYVESGSAPLNTGASDTNFLMLSITGNTASLYVNDQEVSFDLYGPQEPGQVGVGTGFYEGYQRSGFATPYVYTVFSLD